MCYSLACLLLGLVPHAPTVAVGFEQMHPYYSDRNLLQRSPGQTRAVVLIHGFSLHTISAAKVFQARFHTWQMPDSHMVRRLRAAADVFAFTYGQNVSLEEICRLQALPSCIAQLRQMGYAEIVIVGHSAGGLIARAFVEDYPSAGVTRVVQVCTPNLGSNWARADVVRREQEPFLFSLTKEHRQEVNLRRARKKVPEQVEFVCVVGITGTLGDGLVASSSQWPEDLQVQGVPGVRLNTTHFTVMHSRKTAERIADLACTPQPRWSMQEWRQRRRFILAPAPLDLVGPPPSYPWVSTSRFLP